MNEDEKLENMLSRRHIAPAGADLAERIILHAGRLPQRQNLPLWHALRQMFAEFHLPRPGYVLAAALLLGVVLGFTTAPENGSRSDSAVSAAQSYIASDEEFL